MSVDQMRRGEESSSPHLRVKTERNLSKTTVNELPQYTSYLKHEI